MSPAQQVAHAPHMDTPSLDVLIHGYMYVVDSAGFSVSFDRLENAL